MLAELPLWWTENLEKSHWTTDSHLRAMIPRNSVRNQVSLLSIVLENSSSQYPLLLIASDQRGSVGRVEIPPLPETAPAACPALWLSL